MKKIIVSLCVSIMLVVGLAITPAEVFASALSSAQINAIIGLLQSFGADSATISNVQTALTGGQPTVSPAPVKWCHDFNRNLKIGDSSSEATALHQALEKEGIEINYTAGRNGANNEVSVSDVSTFGEYTASAVVDFQEKYASEILTPNGLKRGTGFVGASTRKKLNSLYGCGNAIKQPVITLPVTTSTQPSITIISPKIGNTYKAGDKMIIEWQSKNISVSDKVSIAIWSEDGISEAVYDSVNISTNNTGTYTWTMPYAFRIGKFNYISIGYLYGKGEAARDQRSFGVSTATATSTQSSITVLSPNGGENWKAGETYQIKWQSQGVDSSEDIYISVQGASFPGDTAIERQTKNTGSYNLTIPNDISGEYTILIMSAKKVAGHGNGTVKISATQTIGQYDTFAKCLASKTIMMFGNENFLGNGECTYCKKQKDLFGSAFQYVHYVDCASNPAKCVSGNITGYPTWVFTNGEKIAGLQSLETLSQKGGCELSSW